jgi:RNA polymerase sigma factor (TIGR02999 family)
VPSTPESVDITGLLARARQGEQGALDAVFPHVYDDLRRTAHRELGRWRPGETLDTTALVHEAYLRLVDARRADYADRRHFYATAATAMRHIIVDHARQQRAARRGGGRHAVSLEGLEVASPEAADEVVALDEALTTLGHDYPRLARVVELRFFAGLSVEETADAMDLSPRTVKREWQKARALLFHAMHPDAGAVPEES